MRAKRPPRRISTIIILAFSVFVVAILAVMSFISYYYSYGSMRDRSIADTEVILAQAGKNIGRYITSIKGIAGFINSNAQLLFPGGEVAPTVNIGVGNQSYTLREGGADFLEYVPLLADGINSVFIFDENNNVIYKPDGLAMKKGYDITREEWYKKVEGKTTPDPEITSTQVRMMTERENPWVISISGRMMDGEGNVRGTQLIELNYRVIEEIVSDINLGSRGYVFIVDASGNMVYHPQLQLIYSGLKSENIPAILESGSSVLDMPQDNKLYNITTVPGTDFYIVGVMYRDEIVASANEMILIYILLVLVMCLAAFIGSVQMARYVTRPLDKLEAAVNEVEQGNLNAQFDIKGTLETEKFAESLGSMVGTIKQLMEQVVEDQEVIRTSEIRALQAQINPHFLYNTLDSIVWIAEDTGNEKIKEITMALASYFRIVLSSGKDVITVREELEHVRNYLVIQKMRYENMDFDIEVDPEVQALYMPKIILQPIVENAIYHGIKNSENGGVIWVRSYIKRDGGEEALVFEIEDNGRGMRPQELRAIFRRGAKLRVKQGGVGIRNIKERIALYYGEKYGLTVESVYRQGTKVTVTLPVNRSMKADV